MPGRRTPKTPRPPLDRLADGGPVLLSGGNPQIPKGDGDAPVQAYIAAMPGWKREVGQWLDALVVRSVLVPALVLDVGPRVWWPSRLQHDPAAGATEAPAPVPVGAEPGAP